MQAILTVSIDKDLLFFLNIQIMLVKFIGGSFKNIFIYFLFFTQHTLSLHFTLKHQRYETV